MENIKKYPHMLVFPSFLFYTFHYLQIKDSKFSEIMDIYEHKLVAHEVGVTIFISIHKVVKTHGPVSGFCNFFELKNHLLQYIVWKT